MSVYKLPLVLEPQAEGGYVVTCPLLPELVTEGETVQDALANAHNALLAVIVGPATGGWDGLQAANGWHHMPVMAQILVLP